MKRSTWIKLGLFGLTAMALSACGGGGGSTAVTTTPPVTTLKLEDTFGTQFGTDFRAAPNSEPVKPAPGDVIPLDLTSEPKALH